jgi:CRP/FNR family transcriptional regulator, cyclic AMP receptor protein
MATRADTIQFLQRVPLFQGLDNRQLDRVAQRLIERHFPAGERIVTQGQVGQGLFIMVSGRAEATRERLDGTAVVVNTFGPTDFFGEMALLDEGVRTATVQALEATDCLALTYWDFQGILKQDADMAVIILQVLARRFRAALDALQ